MSSADIQSCTAGRWHGVPPQMIGGVSTDTRHLHCGDAFVALRGPNFNGHAFAEDAIQAGATTLIGDLEGVQSWQDIDVPQLEVADTLQAYGEIAGKWRTKISAKVVAITGSYGKTTLRSMLEHVLNRHGVRIAATHANNNNLIGVPQTLLAIDEQAEVALVECGISERGEMCRLAAMVRPDVAVITGVAEAHAEGLGGIVEVASEKAILLDYMTNEACAVLGHGVAGLLSDTNRNTVILDMESNADSIVKWQMSGDKVTLIRGAEYAEFQMPLPASHWAQDAAIAATVLGRIGVGSLQSIAEALGAWQPVNGRMHQLNGTNACTILDDSYNANPASMAAALNTLRQMPGRRIAVLSDMAELGAETVRLHAEVDVSEIELVIAVGEQMRVLAALQANVYPVNDAEQALSMLRDLQLGRNDVLLVKGSRCMHMERIVNGLTGGGDAV